MKFNQGLFLLISIFSFVIACTSNILVPDESSPKQLENRLDVVKMCGNVPSLKFEDLPEAKLLSDIGNSQWEISTVSDSAQIFFNQGLNALHSFWDVEAFKAFKKGLVFDPKSPLLNWGLAQSISRTAGELQELKKEAISKSLKYSTLAMDYERDFIEAFHQRATHGMTAYKSHMEEYMKMYPEQIEPKLFYASSLSTSVHSHSPNGIPTSNNIRGQEILKVFLESQPKSSAANHYMIHALENGPNPEKAIVYADRITALAPASGHITHMPGHIYYRVGNYSKAISAFYNSLNVDSTYMELYEMDPINNWNYTHNIDYLVAACAESGRYEEGLQWATILSNINLDRSRSMTGGSGYILFGGYTAIPRFHLRFQEWEKAANSISGLVRKIPWSNSSAINYLEGIQFYAMGMHLISAGNVEKASYYLKKLIDIQRILESKRPEIAADWYYRYAVKILDVHLQELAGLIEYKKGNTSKAIELLNIAAEDEKNIGYWEPPHYTRPVYESLGWIHTEEGNLKEAKESYLNALKRRPKNGHAQFALARAMETLKDEPATIVNAYKTFLDYWHNAIDFEGSLSIAEAYINGN